MGSQRAMKIPEIPRHTVRRRNKPCSSNPFDNLKKVLTRSRAYSFLIQHATLKTRKEVSQNTAQARTFRRERVVARHKGGPQRLTGFEQSGEKITLPCGQRHRRRNRPRGPGGCQSPHRRCGAVGTREMQPRRFGLRAHPTPCRTVTG